MVVQYNKKFLKDLSSLPKKDREKIENFVFEDINQYANSGEINKLESFQATNIIIRLDLEITE